MFNFLGQNNALLALLGKVLLSNSLNLVARKKVARGVRIDLAIIKHSINFCQKLCQILYLLMPVAA